MTLEQIELPLVQKRKRTNPPSIISIVEYWENHCDVLGLEPFHLERPNCFACGHIPSATVTGKRWKWGPKTRLQKAHIIPKSVGGDMEQENFLLLCDTCHKEAPDIGDRELVLRWVRNRPEHMVRLSRDVDDAFTQFGYPNWQDIPELMEVVGMVSDKEGVSGSTTEWTTHGAKVSVSTMIALNVKKYERSVNDGRNIE